MDPGPHFINKKTLKLHKLELKLSVLTEIYKSKHNHYVTKVIDNMCMVIFNYEMIVFIESYVRYSIPINYIPQGLIFLKYR